MKKPYVISMMSQKGGVGKTTSAINFSHGISKRGLKVLLVDADPQGSSRDWNEANNGEIVPVICLNSETLPKNLDAVKSGYDIVIIDTPPRIAKISAAALRASDLCIIPVQPSPFDVLATAETVDLIRYRQEIAGSPKAVFLINRVIKNTLLSKEVMQPLIDYGFPILNSKMSQFISYAQSASDGQTIYTTKSSEKAVAEIESIIDEVFDQYINIVSSKVEKGVRKYVES